MSFAVVEYSSAAEAEQTVVAMETSQCVLQMNFCVPGEAAVDVFNRLLTSEVISIKKIDFTKL